MVNAAITSVRKNSHEAGREASAKQRSRQFVLKVLTVLERICKFLTVIVALRVFRCVVTGR